MAPTADSTSSTEPGRTNQHEEEREPACAPGGVPLGRIVGAHGLRGELRVRASDDDQDILLGVPSVRLARDEGDEDADDSQEYEVASARRGRSGECRLALRGVGSREAAEALRGATVIARTGDLAALPDGEFYAYELVGCAVFDAAGRSLGVVASIGDLGPGGTDLLVIEGAGGREHLVPAAEPVLREVDLAARRVVVDPPRGLLDPSEG